VHAPFRALGSFAFCAVLVLASAAPLESVQAAAFPPGSQVEGHVGADWSPCTVVGDQLRTGGYVLHCDAVPDDNVFSATDVRQPAAAQQAPVGRPPAAGPQGRPVQGLIRGNWEDCAMIGNPLPTGGSVLHCDSLPDDTVFSASEVRQIGAAQPAQLNPPAAGLIGAAQVAPPPPAAPQGRPVQGLIRGNWEDCAMIGRCRREGICCAAPRSSMTRSFRLPRCARSVRRRRRRQNRPPPPHRGARFRVLSEAIGRTAP
jgi:hypothetical protein